MLNHMTSVANLSLLYVLFIAVRVGEHTVEK